VISCHDTNIIITITDNDRDRIRDYWAGLVKRSAPAETLEFYSTSPEEHLDGPSPRPKFTFKYVTITDFFYSSTNEAQST
jgi:hypothetical protein